ncbi:MAG: hypothetical protein GY758_15685 [Fuerstiella sp.]|nr:hypothetical protein [Fuerstiella sp.]
MKVKADGSEMRVEMMQPTKINVHCQGQPSSDGVLIVFFEMNGWGDGMAEIYLTAEQVVELRGKLADDAG